MKFLQAILLFLVVSCTSAQTLSGLSASTFINTVSTSLSGSLRGGRTIYIYGIGFPQDPRQLQVWVGSYPCKIPADGVTPTVISCETTDSYSEVDIGSLSIKIIVDGTQDYTIPSTTFTYADSDTPLITDVFPSTTIASARLSYYARHRVLNSGNGIRDMGDFLGLYVGGSLCSMFDIDQGSISYNGINRVQCVQSPVQEAGKYNITEHVVAGWAKKDYTMRKPSLSKIYYEHTVLPSVQSFTPVEGFKTGQDLVIQGTGFSYDASKIQVKADGVICDVTSSTLSTINCRLRAKQTSDSALISTNSSTQTKGYVSGSGFDYWRYDISGLASKTVADFKSALPTLTNLTLIEQKKVAEFDTADVYGTNYGQVFKGYFYAPVNGNYIFRGAGDDQFSLLMTSNYGSTSAPLSQIISSSSYGASIDNYYISNYSTTLGSPIELQAGKYYYMELYHINTGSSGWLRISVEVPNTDTTLPKQRYELNHFETNYTNDPQLMQFTLSGAAGGKFNLSITRINPSTLQVSYNKAVTLNYNATTTQFQNAISQFDIFSNYGVTCTSVVGYDAANQPTSISSGLAAKIVWKVKIDKLRTTSHLADSFKARFDNLTNITDMTPTWTQARTQDHCPLIAGTFTLDIGGTSVKVYDTISKTYSLYNIPFNVAASSLQAGLRQIVGFEKVEVTRSGDPLYGAKWLISYNEYMNDVPDMVLSGSKLTGGLAGTSPVIAGYVTRPYSSNILYNPVNQQFLFSAATGAQIVVSVNGLKSSCINDCTYTFLDTVPEVTSQTKNNPSGTTISVAISDPLNQNFAIALLTVKVDGQLCTIASGAFASFTCTLPINTNGSPVIRAGSYDVQVVVAGKGVIAVQSNIPKLVYDFTLTSTTPTSGSKMGGFIIKISGTGFPNVASEATISVCGKTAIISQITNTDTWITAPACPATSQDISFSYKGATKTISFTYTDTQPSATIDSISPTVWSPVLKSVMTITGSGFGTDSTAIKVHLANSTGKIYQMRVISVINTQIKCGIPGGMPGDYKVQVSLNGVGDIGTSSTTAADFSYKLAVSSITPTTGSFYGGTLVTITGGYFSPNLLQNIVSIGNQLNTVCRIEELTTSQIKCRMPPTHRDWTNSTQGVTVSNKLIVDSTCPSSNCGYTYLTLDSSPNITAISATVAVTSGKGTILLTGNRLDAVAGAKVVLQNKLTAVLTVVVPNIITTTTVNFTIPNLQAGTYAVRVRLDPMGQTNSLDLKLKASLNATAIDGSISGGAIILKGYGLPETWPSKLFTLTITFNSIPIDVAVFSTNSSVMQVGVPKGIDGSAYTLTLKTPLELSVTATLTQRTNSTPTYSLLSTSPTASGSQLISLNRTTLNGKKPYNVSYYNILDPLHPTLIPTWTENGAAIEFTINLKAGAYQFAMWYADYGWASCPFTLQVTAASTYTATATISSLNGGLLTVSGTDISPSAVIKVGGFIGKVRQLQSNAAIFQIPPLITSEVLAQYPELGEESQIQAQTIISDGGNNPQAISDSIHASFYSSSSASCYIGIDAGVGKVINIKRIRYFPYYKWNIAANFIKGAVFQASNDGNSYTPVGLVDQTVHAGWNSILVTSSVNYRYVRLKHTSLSGCKLSQFQVFGVLLNNLVVPDLTSFPTNAIFTDGYNQFPLNGAITYTTVSTPVIDAIGPNNGTIYGGTLVTFDGTNFNAGTPKVYIDNIQCIVDPTTITSTQFKCTTGPRLSLPSQNSFVVTFGTVKPVLKDQFIYVMRWSDIRTWGTDLPPVEGDLVYVPKGMTLLVDQSTPRLDGIVVEDGKLIFSDQTDMEIHTNLITVNRGQFRAGTEDKPYKKKLTFIMYGSYYGKQQPMFGNKGIGCMECKFSMHGTPRVKTWTMITSTINIGDATFSVIDTVDWKVGEQIVVASTDFDHNQAEQRTIVSITGTTITVNEPFNYKHFGGVQTYGSDRLQMRAEVGLLTRNIKMMGDPTSEAGEYGSHLMMAGSAQKGLVAHIAYTQFTHCGQPRIVGRYCMHFHMNGDVPDSYSKGNAVHHSFARVITLHGVHYLRVSQNVGYRVKGHNFFIQDGIQTQNVIEYNLVIGSLESWNMMQTDISVASYWVTNPFNHLRYNRAAGGDFYGFWYEIKEHPDGPSSTEDICPIGNPLGESHDNVAHSYKRFGLRIFKLYSREKPCEPIRDDSLDDPWSQNPSKLSRFYNYVTYKNGQAGLLAEQIGHMLFQNFTIAESYRAGMEFYRTNFTRPLVQARNIAIIGITSSNPPPSLIKFGGVAGVIGPRTSGWKISNIRFYNFPSNMHVLQTCSHCDNGLLYTNTAHEYLVQGISYTNVTGQYLRMNGLKRQIIYDLDGSFSRSFNGATPRPSATIVYNFKHLAQDSACSPSTSPSLWDDALMCDQTAKVRRVMFTNLRDKFIFNRAPMKIQKLSHIDQVVDESSTDFTDINSCDQSGMDPMLDQKTAYAIAFIAGRIYNIWWLTGLDFTHLNMDVTRMFDDSDPAIIFKFNYTQVRQLYEVGHLINGAVAGNLSAVTMNTSLDSSNCQFSDYTHDVDNQTLTLCASSRGKVREFEYLDVLGIRCRYICPSETGEFVKEKFIRYWSNTSQWPNGQIPTDGENVTIPGEWTILVDIQPNKFGYWLILGDVIVPDTMMNLHIIAQNIWIKSGSFKAGTSALPHPGRITIQLIGNKNDRSIVIDPEIAGNKMFVVTGKLELYGEVPARIWTKLAAMARPGDTTIQVVDTIDWVVGDQIAIAPSFSSSSQHEKVTITSINGKTITFSPALLFKHYGAATTTISNAVGQLDTRAGVGLLSRNIVIKSGQDSGWGYHLLVYGYMDDTILRAGSAILRGIQLYEGGQYDTQATALKLLNTISTKTIQVYGSAFHECKSFCIDIKNINNANIRNNVFYKGRLFHVRANQIRQFTFENNLMIAATKRPTFSFDELIACYATFTPIHENTVSIRHNLCQGADNHGFVLPYIPCDLIDTPPYEDNTVGSAIVGHVFNKIPSTSCLAASGAKAYACNIAHIASSPGTIQTIYTKFMMADSNRGVTLRFGKQNDDSTAYWRNSYVSAISRPTCTECYGSGAIQCTGARGVRMLAVTVNGESLPTIFGHGFDVICKQQTFDAKAFLDDIIFQNFNLQYRQLPQCGNNAVFEPHRLASDMTGSHHLHNTVCNNCSLQALARFTPPLAEHLGWSGGCGRIPCTGKNNYLITDYTGSFLGTPGFLLANNSEIGDNTPSCTFVPAMNGHFCKRLDFGVIEYESIAPDFNTRIMWPVYLKFDGGLWNTSTNGWRQWDWEGNQPLNHRLARFVSVVQVNQVYNMTFQSEPPIDMRFQFQRRTVTGNSSEFIVIKLYYPRPNSIRVMNRGNVIKPISLLDNNGEAGLDTAVCGSNKFFYQNYTVHFVLTADKNCQVRVSLTNSIQLTARFSMDINDFFSNDGKTKFIDRMCAVLGIVDTSRLKIVGIYNGSVIIKAYIDEQLNTTTQNATLNNNTLNEQQITAINQKLNKLYENGQLAAKLQEEGLPLVGMDSSLYFHWDEPQQSQLQVIINQTNTPLIIGLTLAAAGILVAFVAGVLYVRRQRAKVDLLNQPTDHKIYDTIEDVHMSQMSKREH